MSPLTCRLSSLLLCTALAAPAVAGEVRVSLEEALAAARTAGEDWEIAGLRVEESRALRREALATLLPSLSVGASGAYNGVTVSFDGRSILPRYDWDASGRLAVTVFDGTRYPAYRQSERLLRAAEADAAWTRRTLLHEVETAFWELAAVEEQLRIAERAVTLRRAYLEQATALQHSELALPIDVARARAQLLEAQQLVIDALGQLENQADALAVLIGRTPDGALRASAPLDAPLDPPTSEESLPAAPRDRPDLESLRLGLEAGELEIDSRWWSVFPTLDLVGQGRAGVPSFSAPDGYTWSLTLNLSWTLYDGGARYARLDAARARSRVRLLELARAQRAADATVARELRSWRLADASIEVASEMRAAAGSAYEMARARFEAGTASSIEVEVASDDLLRAEYDLTRARLRARLARAAYDYVSDTASVTP